MKGTGARPYGSFETLLPQLGAAFSRVAEKTDHLKYYLLPNCRRLW